MIENILFPLMKGPKSPQMLFHLLMEHLKVLNPIKLPNGFHSLELNNDLVQGGIEVADCMDGGIFLVYNAIGSVDSGGQRERNTPNDEDNSDETGKGQAKTAIDLGRKLHG